MPRQKGETMNDQCIIGNFDGCDLVNRAVEKAQMEEWDPGGISRITDIGTYIPGPKPTFPGVVRNHRK